ncbi:MAG: RdgB/HAM1 family non-canonical purine NTP pyrophosphatase [Nitrospirae bacterium]|nr:RdgB/HAM1 family non-canonical purine NTP pyrophosphatase [Nitrospirota bacterium]MBI3593666.1 RdgB/HAM1 family non-canonical purine NTP pyrophosphatase [Nitrospirota bacterium]
MEIVLATRNKGKIKEISALFTHLPIKLLTLDQFPDVGEVEEDGKDCKENAIKKGVEISRETGKAALADDSALEIDALDGAPGVYSARFAGENATYADNRAKVLTLMKGMPAEKRAACFRTILALVIPGKEPILAEGKTEGTIGMMEQGQEGFGYDPIFHLKGDGRSYSQMSAEEKNRVSHRAKAAEKMKALLENILREDKK